MMGEHTPAPTPSRSVYGFALYLACVCAFGLYVIWAVVPDSLLHTFGITYYPQKYWALALPIYVMMGVALFAFFVYPSLNQLLVPPLDSSKTITDSYATATTESSQHHGISPAGDLHISQVCRHMYLNTDTD